MKKIILILHLLSVSIVLSQKLDAEGKVIFNTNRDSTYYSVYNEIKELYIARISTPEHQILREMRMAFRNKMKSAEGIFPQEVGSKIGILEWLKINWKKTGFKSYEQAEEEWNLLTTQDNKIDTIYPELREKLIAATLEYGPTVLIDLVQELAIEYPDKF